MPGASEYPKGRRKTGGRKKGTPNKTTRIMKEAAIMAAEMIGSDGKGKDGLTGYLFRQAKRFPKSYLPVLRATMPYTITGPNDGPLQVVNRNMTPKESTEAYMAMLKRTRG